MVTLRIPPQTPWLVLVALALIALTLIASARVRADDKDRERRVRVALAVSGDPLPRAPMPRVKGATAAAPIDWLIRLPEPEPVAAPYAPDLPAGAVRFPAARYTQSISVLFDGVDRDIIEAVEVKSLPDKRWHQPGGLEGLSGWKTEKFRTIPAGKEVKTWVGNIGVKNSFGFVQQNRGLLRSYPDGTRFDELLTNAETGRVFEHRVREKLDGKWISSVEFKDEAARPVGYSGLKVSCSSCHNEAGTGGYAVGLVPGGDTVLSDPLPWAMWKRSPERGDYKATESKLFAPKKK